MNNIRTLIPGALLALILGLVMVLSLPGAALAQDAKRYRDEISQHNARLTELRQGEAGESMRSELEQTDAWLQEALVQVGKEKFKAVQALLRRAQVQLDFVEATIDHQAVARAAEEMRTRLDEMKTRASELKTRLEALQQQEQALQQQLSSSAGGTR